MARLRVTIDLDVDTTDYLEFDSPDEQELFLRDVVGASINVLDARVLIHREDPRVYCYFGIARQASVVSATIEK